jgi:hypothetical protein
MKEKLTLVLFLVGCGCASHKVLRTPPPGLNAKWSNTAPEASDPTGSFYVDKGIDLICNGPKNRATVGNVIYGGAGVKWIPHVYFEGLDLEIHAWRGFGGLDKERAMEQVEAFVARHNLCAEPQHH